MSVTYRCLASTLIVIKERDYVAALSSPTNVWQATNLTLTRFNDERRRNAIRRTVRKARTTFVLLTRCKRGAIVRASEYTTCCPRCCPRDLVEDHRRAIVTRRRCVTRVPS